jgi:alpha-glucosidase/alpha-D-xyloside xylohydrolase
MDKARSDRPPAAEKAPCGSVSRRNAMKRLGAAGAGLLIPAGLPRGVRGPIIVAGRPVEIAVSALGPATIRLTAVPLEGGRAAAIPDDGALAPTAEGRTAGRGRTWERLGRISAGGFTVRFAPDPPAVLIEMSGGRPVQRLTLDSAAPGLSFRLGEGPLLGLGQGGPQFDRKGSVDKMRNGQAGYRLATHGGRAPVQWLVGTDGWGMFIRHPLGEFDFTGTEGKLAPFGDGLPLDVFITASADPAAIMREYARITGFPELPALWTLGYMQSHRTLAGPGEILGVARTMREKKLPCDALIYLGTEFTPSGWNTRNGEFAWHEGNFPDPEGMVRALHERRFKVVLHIVIEGRRLSGAVNEPCRPENAVPSGRDADDRWPDDRSVPCYWPYHRPLYDAGIDGWWVDQGDGLDLPSRLNRHRMYWEGSQLWRPNERPFALHRNGAAGMQRYGAFLWSGDVRSRWETLKTHVPVAVNTGLSGIPFWGTDIGGFIPTEEYTGELHVRWFQFGAFCPSFRAHGRHWHLKLPWGWDGGDGGPEETRDFRPAPEELRNKAVEPILRKYLELRYRMLPYTYTAVEETCRTGLPVMRALWLHYSDDPAAAGRGDQYLWGRDVLVSPVVDKGASVRRLYLPKGTWWDFWTEQRLEGGREIERPVDLATLPLHVRAGAIIPFGPVRQHTGEPVEGPLTLIVYPGADGASSLYEDDGSTFDYRFGEWVRLEMAWKDGDRRLSLRLAPGPKAPAPAKRAIEVRVAGETRTTSAVFDGTSLELGLEPDR